MKTIRRIIAGLLLITAFSAHADVIWDESVDGDLNSTFTGTDLGVLNVGANDIFGRLNGGGEGAAGSDEFDVITFTAPDVWTFDVLRVAGRPLFSFLYVLELFDTATGPVTDVWGTNAAGFYRIALVPQANRGAVNYGVRINVNDASPVMVSEPGSLALLGIALLGMGLVRRRKES